MFHTCFMTIPTCFVHTLYRFDAFSGTNLLTRCRSASSCFLLFLVSEILVRKYSRNRTKSTPSTYFHWELPEHQRGTRGEAQGLHTRWRRGPGGRAPPVVWWPQAPSDS